MCVIGSLLIHCRNTHVRDINEWHTTMNVMKETRKMNDYNEHVLLALLDIYLQQQFRSTITTQDKLAH